MDGPPCLLADMVLSYHGAFVAKKPICKLTMRCIRPACGLLTRLRLLHGTIVQRSIDIMAGCEVRLTAQTGAKQRLYLQLTLCKIGGFTKDARETKVEHWS